MGRYLIRRAIISVVTLIAISMVVFGILAIAPGDPLSGFANNPNVPPELRERIRDTMGLNDPIHVQYLRWAKTYVTGDWLQSYSAKIPVRDYVMSRLPTTLMISGSAFLLSMLVAIPIGVLSAVKTWGTMLLEAKDRLEIAPHEALFPGTVIFLTVLSINYIGDGLRDALDPRKTL